MEDIKVKEIQNVLYGLFQKHIFSIDGYGIDISTQQAPIMVVEKDELLDASLKVINELGEALAGEEDDIKS